MGSPMLPDDLKLRLFTFLLVTASLPRGAGLTLSLHYAKLSAILFKNPPVLVQPDIISVQEGCLVQVSYATNGGPFTRIAGFIARD